MTAPKTDFPGGFLSCSRADSYQVTESEQRPHQRQRLSNGESLTSLLRSWSGRNSGGPKAKENSGQMVARGRGECWEGTVLLSLPQGCDTDRRQGHCHQPPPHSRVTTLAPPGQQASGISQGASMAGWLPSALNMLWFPSDGATDDHSCYPATFTLVGRKSPKA